MTLKLVGSPVARDQEEGARIVQKDAVFVGNIYTIDEVVKRRIERNGSEQNRGSAYRITVHYQVDTETGQLSFLDIAVHLGKRPVSLHGCFYDESGDLKWRRDRIRYYHHTVEWLEKYLMMWEEHLEIIRLSRVGPLVFDSIEECPLSDELDDIGRALL